MTHVLDLSGARTVVFEEQHHVLFLVEGGERPVHIWLLELEENSPGIAVLRHLHHAPVRLLQLHQAGPEGLIGPVRERPRPELVSREPHVLGHDGQKLLQSGGLLYLELETRGSFRINTFFFNVFFCPYTQKNGEKI